MGSPGPAGFANFGSVLAASQSPGFVSFGMPPPLSANAAGKRKQDDEPTEKKSKASSSSDSGTYDKMIKFLKDTFKKEQKEQLVEKCKEHGLDDSGTKSVLSDRLVKHFLEQ